MRKCTRLNFSSVFAQRLILSGVSHGTIWGARTKTGDSSVQGKCYTDVLFSPQNFRYNHEL